MAISVTDLPPKYQAQAMTKAQIAALIAAEEVQAPAAAAGNAAEVQAPANENGGAQ